MGMKQRIKQWVMILEIIDYDDKYNDDMTDLLVELQEYISEIDREHYNILTKEYREKYFEKTLNAVNKYAGKIFLARENEKVVGLIVGIINNENEDTYDFRVPKRGRVTELVVSKNFQSKGIGQQLLDKMESYFKEVGCKGVLIDVFAYNVHAQKFYDKNGYFNRSIEIMKKI